jgi:hypothetical protein
VYSGAYRKKKPLSKSEQVVLDLFSVNWNFILVTVTQFLLFVKDISKFLRSQFADYYYGPTALCWALAAFSVS